MNGVIQTTIVAIDALDLRWTGAKNQYSEEYFLRELNKAYVGFMRIPGEDLPEVATGTSAARRNRIIFGFIGLQFSDCGIR